MERVERDREKEVVKRRKENQGGEKAGKEGRTKSYMD